MSAIKGFLRGLAVAAAFGTSMSAWAATAFGKLTSGGKPVSNTPVTLTCGNQQSMSTSDANGNFSVAIAASGPCTLTVQGKQGSVNLGPQPVRYNFEVPAQGSVLIQK